MENKNTIIAVVLMLAVWIGFTFLFPSPQAPPPSVSSPADQRAPEDSKETAAPSVSSSIPVESQSQTVSADGQEVREILIENDLFKGKINTSGARLTLLELKKFSETAGGDSSIALVQAGPQRQGTLRTAGVDGLALSPDAVYSVESPEVVQIGGEDKKSLVFTTRTSGGLIVEKTLTFYGNSYRCDVALRVRNTSASPVQGSLQLALVQPWHEDMKGGQFEFVGPVSLTGGEVEKVDVEDLDKSPVAYGADVTWTGFVTKYFINAAVPLEGAAAKVQVEKNAGMVINNLVTPFRTFAPGETAEFNFMGYFGPKDLDILKAVDHQLSEAIDFGFFSFLARPLLHVLKFFYSYIHNYGLAIILLTVIIKLLFWPLTHKSYTSMKDMQKLQPQMQKIREKYKNDRERLNREVMELYKHNRVNPLGGCLPMLVQIPVFFALYKVLLESIELRHAPFFLWIQDLSAKDPYYVTPLIMGATMFIQQKMTPSNMDPTQAKIFMLMPVIFTFMFLNFPSGLVVYWLINNVLTIGQQLYINKKKG